MQFEDSSALIRHISQEFGTTLLGCSRGKDSTATWLRLRREAPGLRIIPYYCYRVPKLQFVEESLAYLEEFFGTRIIRVPHPWLYQAMRYGVMQPGSRHPALREANFQEFTFLDLYQAIREDYHLPPEVPVATGVRARDNPIRWVSMQKYGSYREGRAQWYPVYDWRIADVEAEIREAGIELPVDYQLWSRSFDDLDYRYLKPLREHFPEDYAKVLEWFPLIESVLKRMEYREQYHASHPKS